MFKFGFIPKAVGAVVLLVVINSLSVIYLLPNINSVELKVVYLLSGNLFPIIFVVTFSTFVIVTFFIARYVKQNLEYLNFLTKRVTSGNFEDKINTTSLDEFGQLTTNLENLRLNLRDRLAVAEEAKNRAEAILFNVGEGVFAVNLKGEIIIFNQVAEKLVGISKDQLLGQPYNQILQFLDAKTKQDYGSFIDKVLLEGQQVGLPGETVLVTAAKAEIPVAVTSSPVKNQKGIIVGGIVVFRDITHEKEIEEIRTDLISIASHQLRTPLSEIKGLLSLLLDNVAGPLNPKQIEYLQLLNIANERMINLVNDLLNISRIEQGRLQLNFQAVNLGELSKEVFQTLQMRANEKQQVFSLSIDQNLPNVVADIDKTREIISNLMENALKYTFPGGKITARVAADQTKVWVLVEDNGVGIPKNRQKDLFQKFSRVENPLSKITSGTGLGLYAVKQLVEKQNGTVWFTSEEGKGSTFGFALPTVNGRNEKQ